MRRRAWRGGRVTISFQGFRSSGGGERRDLEPVDPRASSPDERLQEREQAAWVRQGLDRLEPRQKALLVLREYEDLSYAEISDLLGLPIGSVKSRIHRARMALKNELQRLRPDWIERRSNGRPRR
jgi:RNA polymerase sigma-70 factor (ECF subfamily)